MLGYLVQRSIGYGLRWQGSVEDSGAVPVVRAPAADGWSPSALAAMDDALYRAASRGEGRAAGLDLLAALAADAESRAVEVLARGGVDAGWLSGRVAGVLAAGRRGAAEALGARAPGRRLDRCHEDDGAVGRCHDVPMHASSRFQGRSAGLGLALLSAFAFGGSGVAAKPLIEAGLDPLHVVWLRVAGAAVVMLPVAWRHRYLVRERPALLAGFGLFAVAGVQAFYFASISRIPVGVALLVEYLAPALVLGWVRFVQRRPVTRAAAVGVVLAVGGLACVVEVWAGLSFDLLGLLLALGAACCQVGYFVLSDHGGQDGRSGEGEGEQAEPRTPSVSSRTD